jgi:ABC-type lipopolysaccharide export system ATPase subunit
MRIQHLIIYINRRKNVKKSKYKAKTGGVVKRMGGGKTSKYRAKGGLIKKKAGKVVLSGMAARRNARRGNM